MTHPLSYWLGSQRYSGAGSATCWRNGGLSSLLFALLANATVLLAQDTPPKPTDPPQPAVPVEKALPLKVTAGTDKKTYKAGDSIKMTLTVKNITEQPVSLRFGSGQRFDFVLREGTKSTGKIVWQWARGHMFTMMVTSQKLEPGKTLAFTAVYPPPAAEAPGKVVMLAAGTYTLTATLTTMGPAPRAFGTALLTVTEP